MEEASSFFVWCDGVGFAFPIKAFLISTSSFPKSSSISMTLKISSKLVKPSITLFKPSSNNVAVPSFT